MQRTEGIREERKQKVATMMKFLSVIMAIFYFVMGAIIAFTGLFANVPQDTRYVMGAVLFIYGAFRFYRVFKS